MFIATPPRSCGLLVFLEFYFKIKFYPLIVGKYIYIFHTKSRALLCYSMLAMKCLY